eukprot:jgi/Ulvmu1/8513/UM044_0047.1
MLLECSLRVNAGRRCLGRVQRDLVRCAAIRSGSDEKIDNLSTVYCDDFKCDSSPQVERTIRSFAKNVELHTKWTITIFAEDAEYAEGGVIKVKGKQYFRELTWNQDTMSDYTTEVTGMRMKDNDNAQIDWTFSGKLTGVPVSGTVTSNLALNVLTGRIEKHVDEVKLTGNPLGAALYKLNKWLWGQKLQARQLGDNVDRALDKLSMDEQDTFVRDARDPTKFFQQQDTLFQDGVQWAIFLAIMWTVWTAYASLEGF